MKLKVIEPLAYKEVEVVWIEANTPDGNFVIQADHAPTTFVLANQKALVYCFKTGKQETMILKKGGILEIKQHEAILLAG